MPGLATGEPLRGPRPLLGCAIEERADHLCLPVSFSDRRLPRSLRGVPSKTSIVASARALAIGMLAPDGSACCLEKT